MASVGNNFGLCDSINRMELNRYRMIAVSVVGKKHSGVRDRNWMGGSGDGGPFTSSYENPGSYAPNHYRLVPRNRTPTYWIQLSLIY